MAFEHTLFWTKEPKNQFLVNVGVIVWLFGSLVRFSVWLFSQYSGRWLIGGFTKIRPPLVRQIHAIMYAAGIVGIDWVSAEILPCLLSTQYRQFSCVLGIVQCSGTPSAKIQSLNLKISISFNLIIWKIFQIQNERGRFEMGSKHYSWFNSNLSYVFNPTSYPAGLRLKFY